VILLGKNWLPLLKRKAGRMWLVSTWQFLTYRNANFMWFNLIHFEEILSQCLELKWLVSWSGRSKFIWETHIHGHARFSLSWGNDIPSISQVAFQSWPTGFRLHRPVLPSSYKEALLFHLMDIFIYLFIHLFLHLFIYLFIFVVLGFELTSSWLLGKFSITWATP
jgi:hypothetical protein